jgi:hypothetical protein
MAGCEDSSNVSVHTILVNNGEPRNALALLRRAVSGHAGAPPSSVMKSRRFDKRKCIRSLTGQERIAGYPIAGDQSAALRRFRHE